MSKWSNSWTFPLSPYPVLSFAAYALVAGEISAMVEPGLVLTPPTDGTQTDDGFLSASEILKLNLDADWVILSSCKMAAGGAYGEPALIGLARAFDDAGV
ncbi:CHAT domain-containing protein [Novosphingopyxis iocasae]|uniref:CHAT domain-containing protein n=1 Tax=Novosphingopyxis iocasae TaxID=2762729 RepID=UPI001650E1B4|nr:CHAT domain-containing protein [Novosphingopyxis iocasae]